jgi:hypothetical protein
VTSSGKRAANCRRWWLLMNLSYGSEAVQASVSLTVQLSRWLKFLFHPTGNLILEHGKKSTVMNMIAAAVSNFARKNNPHGQNIPGQKVLTTLRYMRLSKLDVDL